MTSPIVRIAVFLGAAALVASRSGAPSESAAAPAAPPTLVSEGVLAPPGQGGPAVTYAPAVAPEGARVALEVAPGEGSTTATFRVAGMLPERGYAVHAHVRPCGATGSDAGPHYQDRVDPAATPDAPSSDPAYANPRNEIWLDLRTDASGTGTATTTVPFGFPTRAPASVVVHEEEMTATAPGEAGTAGGRLACLTAAWN